MSEELEKSVDQFLSVETSVHISLTLATSNDYSVVVDLNKMGMGIHVTAVMFNRDIEVSTYLGAITLNLWDLPYVSNKLSFLKSEIAERSDKCKIASWIIDPVKDTSKLSHEEIMARIDLWMQIISLAEYYNNWAFKNKLEFVIAYLKSSFPLKHGVSARDARIIYNFSTLGSKFSDLSISEHEDIGGFYVEIATTTFIFELQEDGSYIRVNKSNPVFKRSKLLRQLKA